MAVLLSSRPIRPVLLIIALFFCLVIGFSSFTSTRRAALSAFTGVKGLPPHKYAFAVLLTEEQPEENAKESEHVPYDLNDEDHYFIGTRMLIYQLLHDPETRNNRGIPFIVMVLKDYPHDKRARLEKDGAHVLEIPEIHFEWMKPSIARWAHTLDKLNVWTLTQYEKVLLLDSDYVIAKPIDGVFEDPATAPSRNLHLPGKTLADEGEQPEEYIMAANSGPGKNHGYPAPRGENFNAGFMVLRPSLRLFEHYLSFAALQDKFGGGGLEQDLLNYVHRRDGNMPWAQVDPDWTANHPTYDDFRHGICSFHEKYWRTGRDRDMERLLLRSRYLMEGYFERMDRGQPLW